MAKNKDKDATPGAGEPKSRADQVRSAVEQAFGATTHGPVRERAQELADELVGAASRFREVLEELRPPTGDELTTLRERVATLERRVAELEAQKATTAKPAAARRTAAKPRATGAKGASASPGASTAKRGAAAARKPRGTGSSS
jgi:polyhydroxyalkanoate synthesis regulator phasin